MNIFLVGVLILKIYFGSSVQAIESFKKKTIKIGKKTIEIEVAETERQLEQGLMYRKNLDENSGMLFIFNAEQELSFWMKNTYIDLTIAYIDKAKKITEIIDMVAVPPGSKIYPTSYPSKTKNQFALEMNRGWFEKNKIKPGTHLDF